MRDIERIEPILKEITKYNICQCYLDIANERKNDLFYLEDDKFLEEFRKLERKDKDNSLDKESFNTFVKIWRTFPDMRFCQLFVNFGGLAVDNKHLVEFMVFVLKENYDLSFE